ncbi:MFS transporter [Bradyrhizobium sp. LA6.7]|uniref:MFS transporter n=1 Tax=unclassified Bradyrhizobium TaxID=2631580 RepID=UPI003390C094
MATQSKVQPDSSKLTHSGLVTLLSGAFLSVMSAIIVNVALPSIQEEFSASPPAISAVVAYYGLAYGVFLIVGGRLGDRYGRRRVFIAGLTIFTVASLLCGLATSITALVGGRILQGIAAAFLFPQVLSIIRVSAASDGERGRAFSAFGIALGLSAIAGQLIGGLLVSADLGGTSWRPIFLINVPFGTLVCFAATRLIPETRSEDTPRLDLSGALLCAVGLALILYPLVEGRNAGWPSWTICSMIAAIPALVCFAADQRRKSRRGVSPLIEPTLFATSSFSSGFAIAFLFHSTIIAFLFTLALFLQIGLGNPPLDAAMMVVPTGVAFLAASSLANRMLTKFGAFTVMLTGGAIAASSYAGCALIALAQLSPNGRSLIPALAMAGFGQGLFLPPLLNAVLASVPNGQAGSASGLVATAQQVGGAFGVAIAGILFLGGLVNRSATADQSPAHAFALTMIFQVVTAVLSVCLLPILVRRKERAERVTRAS